MVECSSCKDWYHNGVNKYHKMFGLIRTTFGNVIVKKTIIACLIIKCIIIVFISKNREFKNFYHKYYCYCY